MQVLKRDISRGKLKTVQMAMYTTTLEASFSAPWPPRPLVVVASERDQRRLVRWAINSKSSPASKSCGILTFLSHTYGWASVKLPYNGIRLRKHFRPLGLSYLPLARS